MSDIVGIESPTHKISHTINGSSASVGFKFGSEPMDKDLIVNIEVKEPHQPRVCVEVNEKGSCAAMVTLFPKFRFADVPAELIFVVDRSGSMGGSRIQEVISPLFFSQFSSLLSWVELVFLLFQML